MKDVKITRPLAIFVEPAYDIEGMWVVHIVGADGLDHVTQGESAEQAVYSAFDLLCILTGRCDEDNMEHLELEPATFDDGRPALRCPRCEMLRAP